MTTLRDVLSTTIADVNEGSVPHPWCDKTADGILATPEMQAIRLALAELTGFTQRQMLPESVRAWVEGR